MKFRTLFRILFLSLILAVAVMPASAQSKSGPIPVYIKTFVEAGDSIGQTVSKDILKILKSDSTLKVIEFSSDVASDPGPEVRLFFFPVKTVEKGKSATVVILIVLFHEKNSAPVYVGASGGIIDEDDTQGAGQFLVDTISDATAGYLQDKLDQAAQTKKGAKS